MCAFPCSLHNFALLLLMSALHIRLCSLICWQCPITIRAQPRGYAKGQSPAEPATLLMVVMFSGVPPQWVNWATVGLLLFAPGNLQLEAAVFALADGPLAAALIAWQSAWVFGSPSHVIRSTSSLHLSLVRVTR